MSNSLNNLARIMPRSIDLELRDLRRLRFRRLNQNVRMSARLQRVCSFGTLALVGALTVGTVGVALGQEAPPPTQAAPPTLAAPPPVPYASVNELNGILVN